VKELEARAMALGKLWLGWGAEATAEQIAVYIEATQRHRLDHLRAAVDHVLRTRHADQGFPKPGDINSVCHRYRAQQKALEASEERKRAIGEGTRAVVREIVAVLRATK
jgi:hypothetical protein